MDQSELFQHVVQLLKQLIATPSFSGHEDGTASLIAQWLHDHGIQSKRNKNNVWAVNRDFDPDKPSILLNSHHDTVRPSKAYTRDPFQAQEEHGKLFGLGSNDAGGALVSLLGAFICFYEQPAMKYNLAIAATAEEENSGPNGLNSILGDLPPLELALVGEPTGMDLAIAEKGLLVIDAVAPGKTGHAAHENSENAIYNAINDISWIRNFRFPKESSVLGPVKMTVTQIAAGQQHNVVPAHCDFVIDVRVNEHYSNEEVFGIIDQNTRSALTPRSFRLNSSHIALTHPIVQAGIALGRKTYGSPTLSDQAVLPCPSVKIGPGDSRRSHQSDEFICLHEIEEGIGIYINMLKQIL